MKSYRKELWFNIPQHRGFVNITRQVEECLKETSTIGQSDARKREDVIAAGRVRGCIPWIRAQLGTRSIGICTI